MVVKFAVLEAYVIGSLKCEITPTWKAYIFIMS